MRDIRSPRGRVWRLKSREASVDNGCGRRPAESSSSSAPLGPAVRPAQIPPPAPLSPSALVSTCGFSSFADFPQTSRHLGPEDLWPLACLPCSNWAAPASLRWGHRAAQSSGLLGPTSCLFCPHSPPPESCLGASWAISGAQLWMPGGKRPGEVAGGLGVEDAQQRLELWPLPGTIPPAGAWGRLPLCPGAWPGSCRWMTQAFFWVGCGFSWMLFRLWDLWLVLPRTHDREWRNPGTKVLGSQPGAGAQNWAATLGQCRGLPGVPRPRGSLLLGGEELSESKTAGGETV